MKLHVQYQVNVIFCENLYIQDGLLKSVILNILLIFNDTKKMSKEKVAPSEEAIMITESFFQGHFFKKGEDQDNFFKGNICFCLHDFKENIERSSATYDNMTFK